MLSAKQIETIISVEIPQVGGTQKVKDLAEKIVAAMPNCADTLRDLMAMQTAMVLGLIVDEEGTGRSNIAYSPLVMADVLRRYSFTVEHEGILTVVRIAREDGINLLAQDEDATGAKPQAQGKPERPIWAVFANGRMVFDGSRAECRDYVRLVTATDDAIYTIQNRMCHHHRCPTTGCNETGMSSEVASGD